MVKKKKTKNSMVESNSRLDQQKTEAVNMNTDQKESIRNKVQKSKRTENKEKKDIK